MADAPKEKKARAPRKPAEHPPYVNMISEAIAALKERSGSSLPALKKCIGEKYGSKLHVSAREGAGGWLAAGPHPPAPPGSWGLPPTPPAPPAAGPLGEDPQHAAQEAGGQRQADKGQGQLQAGRGAQEGGACGAGSSPCSLHGLDARAFEPGRPRRSLTVGPPPRPQAKPKRVAKPKVRGVGAVGA